MENFGERAAYVKRLTRVVAHIYEHLDEELDLARLAEVAALSPHHWHRIYHALYGETAAATVKRLRLQRAAAELAQTETAIEAIAARAGYADVPTFARAFMGAYGKPPGAYRAAGPHRRFIDAPVAAATGPYAVSIQVLAPLDLVAMPHRGSYLQIGRSFDLLFGTLGARDLIRPGLRLIGVYHDDPTVVAEAELRAAAGVVAEGPAEAPLETLRVAGGPYAVLRHQGPYADMKAAYDWLYGAWLVGSGREAADLPVVEEYLNSPQDTAPMDLLSDIFLPLRPVAGEAA